MFQEEIFDSEHVLTIQAIQSRFKLELLRKKSIHSKILELLSQSMNQESSNYDCKSLKAQKSIELANLISTWGDKHHSSLIDCDTGIDLH